jgi:hypothetical protein
MHVWYAAHACVYIHPSNSPELHEKLWQDPEHLLPVEIAGLSARARRGESAPEINRIIIPRQSSLARANKVRWRWRVITKTLASASKCESQQQRQRTTTHLNQVNEALGANWRPRGVDLHRKVSRACVERGNPVLLVGGRLGGATSSGIAGDMLSERHHPRIRNKKAAAIATTGPCEHTAGGAASGTADAQRPHSRDNGRTALEQRTFIWHGRTTLPVAAASRLKSTRRAWAHMILLRFVETKY